MPTIGLIINPMAGRDIRRLVAAASLQSAPEKMLVVRRLFSGMSGIPDTEVMMIDDYEGFGRYALHELNDLLPVKLIAGEKEPSNGASTIDWAKRLEQAGARVIVSVGGMVRNGTLPRPNSGFPSCRLRVELITSLAGLEIKPRPVTRAHYI